MRSFLEFDQYRLPLPVQHPLFSTTQDGANGAFLLKRPGIMLFCIVSDGMGWDHVSVTVSNGQKWVGRTPTWEEMEFVRSVFFKDEELVLQFSVPREQHINTHDGCLHLWRPHDFTINLPPAEMV